MSYFSDPPRPFFHRLFYETVKFSCWIGGLIFFRLRRAGFENLPQTGGMLICSNHASNLDPIMIGCALPRHSNYLGKKQLFKFPPLRWTLNLLDTVPIDRESSSISGMKETLRRLKRDESVVIFPEGKRSDDGSMQPLLSGFIALARRIPSPLIPMGIAGTYQAWPNSRAFPLPGRVVIYAGEPIPQEKIKEMSDEELQDYLAEQIGHCLERAHAIREGRS